MSKSSTSQPGLLQDRSRLEFDKGCTYENKIIPNDKLGSRFAAVYGPLPWEKHGARRIFAGKIPVTHSVETALRAVDGARQLTCF